MAASIVETVSNYGVPAGDAKTTLKQAAEQGGFEIMFPASTVRDVKTKAVQGAFTPMEAVEKMLAGTGLSGVQDQFSGAIAVLQQKAGIAVLQQKEQQAEKPSSEQPSDLKIKLPQSDTELAENDVVRLSPFEVSSEKDRGYLKTNSATATRIGQSIQKIPMNISVISEEFMYDTDLKNTNDIFKYVGAASGDSQVGAVVPSNNQTPQGHMTLRGFLVNVILRNGLRLYSAKSVTDNVERIEVIKGPAAVFFGQGYPGGVVNYITKKAKIAKIPTTYRYTVGANNTNHAVVDMNRMVSEKFAVRIIGSWEDDKGEKSFEYTKRIVADTSMILKPFANERLVITSEFTYMTERFNSGGIYSWIFPEQYFADYKNPSAAMMAAAGVSTPALFRSKIDMNLAAWSAAYRTVIGDSQAPIYTDIKRGAIYTNASGNRIQDEAFSFQNRASQVTNDAAIAEFMVDSKVTDWLDARYSYTKDNTKFNTYVGYWYPNANGENYRLTQDGRTGYYRKTNTHQADFVFHLDTDVLGGLKHKLLTGYLYDQWLQQYMSTVGRIYSRVPGYNAGGTDASNGAIPGSLANVPVNQVLYNRYGVKKSVTDVYNYWDPGFEIQPDAGAKLFPMDRNLTEGFDNQDNAWYVNYQLTALNDRLTALGGFRRETYRQGGTVSATNFPWFAPPEWAYTDTVKYDPTVYNYPVSGQRNSFITQSGDSWMAGVSFEIIKDVNVYATFSKTFTYNQGIQLGYYDPYITGGVDGLPAFFKATLDAYAIAGKPLVYRFTDGTSRVLTTVAQCQQAIEDAGANRIAQNETGENSEIGVKTSLWDGKLTGTLSIFQADRINQRKEDGYHQSIDPFNFNYLPITGPDGKDLSIDGKVRHFRWYGNDAHDRTQGVEFETIWTPTANFQTFISGSWMWQAKCLKDPTIVPGNVNYNIYFNARLESAPEYTLKSFSKYTFKDGPVDGLAVGLGMRYASSTVISRTTDWNPLAGGYQGANHTIFDLTFGYPYELFGYKFRSQLGIYNVADTVYTDGWYSLAPARYWNLSTTLSF